MNAALAAVWSNKVVWVIHVVANAALLGAFYGWLLIPDRTILDLILSALAGVGILLLVSWLHAGTLEYFRMKHHDGGATVRAAFAPSIGRIGRFAAWLVVLCAVIVLVLQLKNHIEPLSNWIASALTFAVRRPVRPTTTFAVVSTVIGILAFVVVPFLMLQLWRWKWSLAYVLTYAVLLAVGAYLPYRLVWWVPKLTGIYAQTASMAVRILLAYLLAVTGWLILVSTLGQIRTSRDVEVHR